MAVQPNQEYRLLYGAFSGGLNLRDAESALRTDESPEMKNLLPRDGLLASRRGQRYLDASVTRGAGRAAFGSLWHGHLFTHCGTGIWATDPETGTTVRVVSGVPAVRGSFFLSGGSLFYKTRGAYVKITAGPAESGGWSFAGGEVEKYTPVILINASPSSPGGDLYQPENRYSARKTVWYNAEEGVREYRLPVAAESVDEVVVDGSRRTSGWSYDPESAAVIFDTAPPVTDPPENNTVRITFTKENPEAYASVDSCRAAEVYGGTGALCVVLGGSASQPNAYFWSGNSDIAMDPGYFPMEQVQLAGETDDPVTGFGKQQSSLIVLQERQVGKTALTVEAAETGGEEERVSRYLLGLPYTPINAKLGCRYPGSIRLVGNDLVWAGEGGVRLLLDTTDAGENLVAGISGKIDGTPELTGPAARRGLLYDLRRADPETVCSADDGRRYALICGGNAYVWDYALSDRGDPSWFLLTGINAVAAVSGENGELYFLDAVGRIIGLQDRLSDFGRGFERIVRTGWQDFGDPDRRKTVCSVLFSLGTERGGSTSVTYLTEAETRQDRTDLEVTPGARCGIFRRKPGCQRVSVFSLKLRNAHADEDLALEKLELRFKKLGRLR